MNRLGTEESAYLASAAHQPVHWHPWGDAAFAKARAEDKPILLDIGAVWCHWCHVMDGESYEDPELAAYLNEHFVCVKVDRDERPDVDARYQRAVQALTGQGGWPLTAALTPDGDVFYGGTYFPPDGKYGRPGFRAVLERVREIYHQQRDKVEATAKELRGHLGQALDETARGELLPDLLGQAAEKMARLFDWRYGGFGAQPKFPHPAAVEFLIARWWDTGEHWLREIAEKTLDGMARGGMHDQLGGGFHRYSVDERWIVPHFEKMAYDNSELLKVYVHAYAALGNPRYREVAEGVVRWSFEELSDGDRGGFAASQDADVGLHDDGDYFTWTADEARAVLADEEWEVARRRWDIYPEGEMHHDPAKNVLWVARSTEALVEELKVEELKVRRLIRIAEEKLRAARAKRPAPFVDRTIYVSWNAMMAEAFFDAGAALGRDDCVAFALRTCERLWHEAFVPGQGMPHRLDPRTTDQAPRTTGPWLLDDQVQTTSAFLAAYEHSGDGRWLDRARELMDMVLAFYRDQDGGGFFDTRDATGAGFLTTRSKPIQDAPTPSSNSVAALVLLKLHTITEEERFRREAEHALESFAGTASELGLHASTYFRAVDWLLNGGCKIVVADTTTTTTLKCEALSRFRPRKAVVPKTASPVAGTAPPVCLVCAGTACATPVTTPGALGEVMESFGRSKI
ncbi:MAG: thioredoxin domain-containing protein [Gemmatimonadetes bacterium]|nr:thioredoxin domain-containing protein [Gemmatimonadota bacterium]